MPFRLSASQRRNLYRVKVDVKKCHPWHILFESLIPWSIVSGQVKAGIFSNCSKFSWIWLSRKFRGQPMSDQQLLKSIEVKPYKTYIIYNILLYIYVISTHALLRSEYVFGNRLSYNVWTLLEWLSHGEPWHLDVAAQGPTSSQGVSFWFQFDSISP
jgi:hypothetical protein